MPFFHSEAQPGCVGPRTPRRLAKTAAPVSQSRSRQVEVASSFFSPIVLLEIRAGASALFGEQAARALGGLGRRLYARVVEPLGSEAFDRRAHASAIAGEVAVPRGELGRRERGEAGAEEAQRVAAYATGHARADDGLIVVIERRRHRLPAGGRVVIDAYVNRAHREHGAD